MKNSDDINPDVMTKEELKAFAKGVKAAQSMLKNSKGKFSTKVLTTSSMIKQSFIDHTIKYLVSTSLVIGLFTGAYFYFVNPVVKKVENTINEVSESKVLHPIENFNKWFAADTHWWSSSKKKNSDDKNLDKEPDIKQHKTIEPNTENMENEKTTQSITQTIRNWFSFEKEDSKE